MTSAELLESMLAIGNQLRENVARNISPLSAAQLNWKPDHRVWSVAECLDHLNIGNLLYFPIIERALYALKDKPEFRDQGIPFQSTLTGNMLIKMVKADNRKRVQSPKIFKPVQSQYTADISAAFLEQHTRLLQFMESARGLNLAKIKVYSPANRIFKFNLGDCFSILIQHDERHYQQAIRLMQHSSFPQ